MLISTVLDIFPVQGLLNEMDGSTWSQLNLADFQMNRSTGTTQVKKEKA